MGVLQGLAAHGGKLYAMWKAVPGDERLFWSSWNGSSDWSPPATFVAATSTGPALAVFDDAVFAAWRGERNDPRLFFSRLHGTTWAEQQQIPKVYSDQGPTLAAFDGKLWAAWKSVFDQSMFFASFNGSAWSEAKHIPGTASSVGPSLAAFDGKLWAAWKGENDDQSLWYASFDGTHWSSQKQIPNTSSVGPSQDVFNNKLYALWKGEHHDQGLWYASFDGTHWSAQKQMPNATTSTGPALAEHGGRLHAMWKGGPDVKIWRASFDGTTWSTAKNDIGGNTGQDSVTMVAPPSAGLGSNSNYLLSDVGNTHLIDVCARIFLTEDLHSSNGFSFQLNCYSPSPQADNCAWQQYGFVVTDQTLSAFVNNWPVHWQKDGHLILEWIPLEDLSANRLPAGYELKVKLDHDVKGRVTGVNWTVVNEHGHVKANLTRTLLSFGAPHFTAADLAPINAFELNLVGPDDSKHATLTSGQGVIEFTAKNKLTCQNSEPAGDLGVGTAETANSFYSKMPAAFSDGDFWQLFSTSATMTPIKRKGGKALRKPAKVR
jgi:hypothetical protein